MTRARAAAAGAGTGLGGAGPAGSITAVAPGLDFFGSNVPAVTRGGPGVGGLAASRGGVAAAAPARAPAAPAPPAPAAPAPPAPAAPATADRLAALEARLEALAAEAAALRDRNAALEAELARQRPGGEGGRGGGRVDPPVPAASPSEADSEGFMS